MAHKLGERRSLIVTLPPVPSPKAPATLIFIHRYNFFADQLTCQPPNHLNVAHHIHQSPLLQHLKIIIPEGLPSIHPSIKKRVWYDIPNPIPASGNAAEAEWFVEYGHSDNNADDMEVTLDYFESLIKSEIANGTPANRIVLMGDSQGAGMVVMLLLTRRLAADLGAVITYAGFPGIDLQTIFRMQREHGLKEPWSKETILFMLHGKDDELVPLEISRAWLTQLERLRDRGQGIAKVEWKLMDGMRHALIGILWPNVREILQRVIPDQDLKPSLKL